MSLRFKIITRVGLPIGTIYGGIYIYRKFNFNVPVYDVPGDLKKYVFVITGADHGIGKATVDALAPTGARVIMACRNIDRCKEIRRDIVISSKNRQVVCRQCDLSSFESVKKFAAKVIKEEPRIDVLINNAGIKYLPKRKITRESIEKQLGVNFVGHHLLTSLLLDKLKESGGPSRIVNVIGNSYKKGIIDFEDLNSGKQYKPSTAYDRSKLAIALTTREMANQLDPTKVTINGVDPGYTYSGIEKYTEAAMFKFIRNAFYYVTRRQTRQGAYPLLYASLSLEMKGVTGKFVTDQLEVVEFDEESTGDKVLQRKMWLTAEKWARTEQAKKEVAELIAAMPDKVESATKDEKDNTKLKSAVSSSSTKSKSSATASTSSSSSSTNVSVPTTKGDSLAMKT